MNYFLYTSILCCDTETCPQNKLHFFPLSFICAVSFPLGMLMQICMTVVLFLSVCFTLSFIIATPHCLSVISITHPVCLLHTGSSIEVDLWYVTRHCHTINTHGLFIYHLFSRVCFIYAHIFIISPLCISVQHKVIYYWVLQPWGAAEDVSL